MKTIFKEQEYKILNEFYKNKNQAIHLRELARKIQLREGPLSRHVNELLRKKILSAKKEANLKKFQIKTDKISQIYTLFDIERFEKLPQIRKKSVKIYIKEIKEKPIYIILFGSTAKEMHRKDSDIDIITVVNKKINTTNAKNKAEAQTGIEIQEIQINYKEFIREIKLKEDEVIQAGIETGYPIYNHKAYHDEFLE